MSNKNRQHRRFKRNTKLSARKTNTINNTREWKQCANIR